MGETKKPLPMEECIKQKEEYATKVQEAMQEMSNQVMGTAWGEKGAPAQAAASKVEALGPIVAKSSTVGVLAGVGLLTALTVAGAAVAARRGLGRMQKSDRERTLVDSLESEEDGAGGHNANSVEVRSLPHQDSQEASDQGEQEGDHGMIRHE